MMQAQTNMPNGSSGGRAVGQENTAFDHALHQVYRRARGKSNGRKVYCDDGRRRVCVGTLADGVFTKRVKDSHILRTPRAIALQDDVLAELRRLGCHTIEALLDSGKVLTTRIERFASRGLRIDRGFGSQTALPLAQWDEDCGQASLFGGAP